MRAVVLTKHGPPDVLEVQDRPDPPPPGPGEVTVAIEAVGIDDASNAHRRLAERKNVGKVVLTP